MKGRSRFRSKQSGEKSDLFPVSCRSTTQHSALPDPGRPHASAMPTHVRCEEHPNRSTWPKLNKFPNCSKTTLEGVVTTENHTHGQIRSTWLHLMPPNVPGAWLSHQVPPAKSCCWGAGFGTLRGWGGERRGAHRGRHTCLSQVHSLKVSIYSEMMPWFCSEARLRLGVTKEQAVVSKSCPAPPHPQHSLRCVLLVNERPRTCHSPATAFATLQCSLQGTQTDGRAWKIAWPAIFKMLCPFSPKREESQSETQALWLPKCSDRENSMPTSK